MSEAVSVKNIHTWTQEACAYEFSAELRRRTLHIKHADAWVADEFGRSISLAGKLRCGDRAPTGAQLMTAVELFGVSFIQNMRGCAEEEGDRAMQLVADIRKIINER